MEFMSIVGFTAVNESMSSKPFIDTLLLLFCCLVSSSGVHACFASQLHLPTSLLAGSSGMRSLGFGLWRLLTRAPEQTKQTLYFQN